MVREQVEVQGSPAESVVVAGAAAVAVPAERKRQGRQVSMQHKYQNPVKTLTSITTCLTLANKVATIMKGTDLSIE